MRAVVGGWGVGTACALHALASRRAGMRPAPRCVRVHRCVRVPASVRHAQSCTTVLSAPRAVRNSPRTIGLHGDAKQQRGGKGVTGRHAARRASRPLNQPTTRSSREMRPLAVRSGAAERLTAQYRAGSFHATALCAAVFLACPMCDELITPGNNNVPVLGRHLTAGSWAGVRRPRAHHLPLHLLLRAARNRPVRAWRCSAQAWWEARTARCARHAHRRPRCVSAPGR